ncbi:TPA: GtrA family protein [Pseudomonas aeruginosa]|nr:GtrA family protein [Pseudomonas aeruginosa]HEJ6244650.1 GtrA family protein [Pseudomonas aeruginosa]
MLLGRFVSVGAGATAVHYLVLTLLVEGFAVGAAVAAAMGAGCGALAAYLGHRRKTFRHRGPVFRSLPRFFAVSLLCVLGNAVLVLLLGDLAGLDYRLAQLAATGALLLATYHLHRLWTFS